MLEKAETGWWCIEYNGVEGWAPADYLAPVVGAPAAGGGAAAAPPPRPSAPTAAAAVPPPRPAAPNPAPTPNPPRPPAPAAAEPAAEAEAEAAAPTHQAASDFFAGSESEVTVKAGDLVTFVEDNDGWWFVVKADGVAGEGWAPADYFEDIDEDDFNSGDEESDGGGGGGGGGDDDDDDDELPAGPAELYLVEDDFDADADDQLTVKKGDTVKLLESPEGGWWWMESADGSAAGWVPSAYVAKI